MTRRPAPLAGLALTLAATGPLAGAAPREAPRSSVVSLASYTLRVGSLPEIPAGLEAEDHEYFLVKYPGPISARQREALDASVERVYTYLPHDTFLVRAS